MRDDCVGETECDSEAVEVSDVEREDEAEGDAVSDSEREGDKEWVGDKEAEKVMNDEEDGVDEGVRVTLTLVRVALWTNVHDRVRVADSVTVTVIDADEADDEGDSECDTEWDREWDRVGDALCEREGVRD